MHDLSVKRGGRCRFGPYVDPPLHKIFLKQMVTFESLATNEYIENLSLSFFLINKMTCQLYRWFAMASRISARQNDSYSHIAFCHGHKKDLVPSLKVATLRYMFLLLIQKYWCYVLEQGRSQWGGGRGGRLPPQTPKIGKESKNREGEKGGKERKKRDKNNIYLFLSYSIEDFKLNQNQNFQLILSMRIHFMRYFVNSIIFRVSHRLLHCVFIEVDFEK